MIRIAITVLLTTAAVLALAGCGKETQADADMSRKAELQRVIDTHYENPAAHYELAKLYHREGNYIRAEFHYNVAIGFDPMNRQAQASLVRLYKDSQSPEKESTAANLYIQQASVNVDTLMTLGRAFQRERMDDYAMRCYMEAERQAPEAADIKKQLGYFYLAKGDKARAEGYLRRSFELNPDQPDVSSELGKMGVQVTVPPRKAIDLLGPIGPNKMPADKTLK